MLAQTWKGAAREGVGLRNPAFVANLAPTVATVYTTNWVTNTWTFASQSLFDTANNASIGLNYLSAIGNPAGSISFGETANNVAGLEVGTTNSTGSTWVQWGVPSTGTVVAVGFGGGDGLLQNNAKLTSHALRFQILDNSSNAVHAGSWLFSTNLSTTTNAGWVALAISNASVAINAGSSAASTGVRLALIYAETNGSSGVLVTQRFDNIKIGVQFYGHAP